MLKSQIKVGGLYTAKVNGQLTTVRVDSVGSGFDSTTYYNVTNMRTGRTTTFRSAQKFRGPAAINDPARKVGGEQCSDPLPDSSTAATTPTVPAASGPESSTPPAPAAASDCLGYDPSLVSGICRCKNCAAKPRDQRTGFKPATPSAFVQRATQPTTTDNSPHLIIEARAGTGKTTTLVEALRRLKGHPTPGFVPSSQQQQVFDAIELSRGKASTICFVAFNKSIADELKSRVPAGCEASTMHSMGFKAVGRAIRLNGKAVNADRTEYLIEELTGKDIWELRREDGTLVNAIKKLVSLCKMNLVDAGDEEALSTLTAHYEVELNGTRDRVFELVPRVLERARDVRRDGFIDYDDMIWLPVVLDLPMTRYDMLLIDEAQDLNRCQQALAKKAGRRLILCGDPKQAIYGFAGADSESMNRMAKELRGQDIPSNDGMLDRRACELAIRGCITLPLTVTRRCGKAIVAEAQKIVPDFEAHESNGEGLIGRGTYPTDRTGKERPGPHYTERVQDGDMVLCRVNAPLVSQCFRFLKAGRRANIQGRDIGQGLVSLIKRLSKGSQDVVQLVAKISDWTVAETKKENAKRFPSEARLIAINDRADCLTCFIEGAATVNQVVAKIEGVFTDRKDAPGILLSSIHRGKGLEANRVFLLEPEGASVPHPMAKSRWQIEQEWNLRYVAVTRAKTELVYVS